jgi:SagB-type dehydrogenase family enzyme
MEFDGVESATGTLHRLTSYEPSTAWDDAQDDPRLLQDFEPNDNGRRTLFTKRYGGPLPRTPLPRELPVTTSPALAVLAGTLQPEAATLDLAGLSRVLHLSAGVVRTGKRDWGTFLYRAAGSAGGRFPLELYVAIPDGNPGLPPGVHWYDPVEHALVQVGPPPKQTQSSPKAQAPTIVVTGIPWRTGWRYRERGFRHIYWDAGTMLSQLLTLAESAGFAPQLYSGFPDAGVSELVGADQVHEWPVALVTLGDGAPAIDAAGPATTGEVDSAPLEFPLVTAAQRAGDTDRLAEPWLPGAAVQISGSASASIDEVITRRGSQRRMDPSRGLPSDTLRTGMAVALRGIEVDHWVAVHDVAGLAPGIYRWPELGNPVRSGSQEQMRAELYRVCLEQALGRDAAFVVIAVTDVSRLSDREYREAQLAAGLVEGRLHLAAYALGASATGMTFLDSEIPALLGGQSPIGDNGPVDNDPVAAVDGAVDALIFTCVGVPGNTSRPGGLPGAPTEVRTVSPRKQRE